MRRHFVAALLLPVLVSVSPAHQWEDGVGIYFDGQATCNCLTDSIGVVVDAYLIVENISATESISGWQGTLWSDSGVIVFNVGFSGNGLNFGTPPEYIVGLATPLPVTRDVVLATFSVIAQNAGGIYFHPLSEEPSPLYAAGSSGETIVAMNSVYGDEVSPDATIGTLECPDLNSISVSNWPIAVPPVPPGGPGWELATGGKAAGSQTESRSWTAVKSIFR